MGHLLNFGFGEGILIGDDNLAVDAKCRRHSGHEMQVRSVEIGRSGEESIEILSAHQEESLRHQPSTREPRLHAESSLSASVGWRLPGFNCCAWRKEFLAKAARPTACWHRPNSSHNTK